jgi:hypothetical protein
MDQGPAKGPLSSCSLPESSSSTRYGATGISIARPSRTGRTVAVRPV